MEGIGNGERSHGSRTQPLAAESVRHALGFVVARTWGPYRGDAPGCASLATILLGRSALDPCLSGMRRGARAWLPSHGCEVLNFVCRPYRLTGKDRQARGARGSHPSSPTHRRQPSPSHRVLALLDPLLGLLACVSSVWFVVQNSVDVLPTRLSGRLELVPNIAWTGRIPPLHAIGKPDVNPLSVLVVRLRHNTT